MTASSRVLPSRYVDSVVLMRLAQSLSALPGVADAAAVMGTDANKALLHDAGYDADGAKADDLVVAVRAEDAAAAAAALECVDTLLAAPPHVSIPTVPTLDEALAVRAGVNLASISVPGEYAAAQARQGLEHGLNVFVFSSNVTLDDELELKRLADERGLLCMGPDCGTAVIGGVGIGFANAVRRGSVGIVGASGSGTQAVTCLLDELGVGISHAIGTGSRDTRDEVGGATTFAGLRALFDDPTTDRVVVVSKPPGPQTAERLRELAASSPKPLVLAFLDELTLEEAALATAGRAAGPWDSPPTPHAAPGRPLVRGLFAGGSLAYEAQLVLARAGLGAEHTIADLGSEELTRGRPHPMIDSRVRRERVAAAAADPQCGVILLDVVLGYGVARDPAGDIARAIAAVDGPLVFASVVGTERDPQRRSVQTATLRRAGAHVFPTSAAAARAATEAVS
jgi:FdrA protein